MTQINHENKNHVETLQIRGRHNKINYNKGVNHPTTVSYTHLDVYKRQRCHDGQPFLPHAT